MDLGPATGKLRRELNHDPWPSSDTLMKGMKVFERAHPESQMVQANVAVSIEFAERRYIGDLPQRQTCVTVGDEHGRVVWVLPEQAPAEAVRKKGGGLLQVRQSEVIDALRENIVLSRFAHGPTQPRNGV